MFILLYNPDTQLFGLLPHPFGQLFFRALETSPPGQSPRFQALPSLCNLLELFYN